MPYILVKNHENLTKTKEVTVFYSLKPEEAGKTPACYNILLSVNSFTVVTNHAQIQKFSSGGGGGPCQYDKKKSSDVVFFCLFFFCP